MRSKLISSVGRIFNSLKRLPSSSCIPSRAFSTVSSPSFNNYHYDQPRKFTSWEKTAILGLYSYALWRSFPENKSQEQCHACKSNRDKSIQLLKK